MTAPTEGVKCKSFLCRLEVCEVILHAHGCNGDIPWTLLGDAVRFVCERAINAGGVLDWVDAVVVVCGEILEDSLFDFCKGMPMLELLTLTAACRGKWLDSDKVSIGTDLTEVAGLLTTVLDRKSVV